MPSKRKRPESNFAEKSQDARCLDRHDAVKKCKVQENCAITPLSPGVLGVESRQEGASATSDEALDSEGMKLTVRDILSHLKLPRKLNRATAPSKPQPSTSQAGQARQPSTSKNVPGFSGDAAQTDTRRKREHHQGSLRKLGQLIPNADLSKKQPPKSLLSGHRIGATPSSRLEPTYVVPDLVLAISRRSSFSVYLKKAMKHFMTRKAGKIRILGMGSAISMALSIALAVQQNLCVGDGCVLKKEVRTATVVVGDEIHPEAKVRKIFSMRGISSNLVAILPTGRNSQFQNDPKQKGRGQRRIDISDQKSSIDRD